MDLTVTGLHLEVTPALREYASKRLSRIENHCEGNMRARIVLSVEKHTHRAQGHVNVEAKEFLAEASGENMYAQIDALVAKLDRQLRDHKRKLASHDRQSGGLHPHDFNPTEDPELDPGGPDPA
ncbi:MAG: ribosome-associated translation inhibitor RaiA [Gammaproteobacteria bacterium]|nr:ribosome-associated translation inhibitor RaiA [Gammaproteobacteria bacterium]